MALFSTFLLSLQLQNGELFEFFSRRMDQIIQRLRNWTPPIILPYQLLLLCFARVTRYSLRYGPSHHPHFSSN